MLGYMNAEALRRTLTEGRVTFWSRVAAGVLAQGRHLAVTPSTCAARRSTATATRSSSRRPGRRRLPHRRARLLRRRPPRARGRESRMSDDDPRRVRAALGAGTGSSRSSASSSPTARPPSASTANSPTGARAPSCSNRPNRAASGRDTRSSVSLVRCADPDATRPRPGSTTASICRCAPSAATLPTAPLAALDALYARWRHPASPGIRPSPAGSSASSAGRPSARSSISPTPRPPTSRCPDRPCPSCRSSSSSTTAGQRARSSPPCSATASRRPMHCGRTRRARLDRMQTRPRRTRGGVARRSRPRRGPDAALPASRPPSYRAAVEQSKRFILDGDVFQVVISQRFDHEITASPIDVYRVLRTLNPSPTCTCSPLEDGRRRARTGSSGRRPRRSSR